MGVLKYSVYIFVGEHKYCVYIRQETQSGVVHRFLGSLSGRDILFVFLKLIMLKIDQTS
jgi:hypothetical protein